MTKISALSPIASKAVILALALSSAMACVPAQARILKYIAVGVAVHMIDKKIDQHMAAKAHQSNQVAQAATPTQGNAGFASQEPAKKRFLTDEQRQSLFNNK